MTAKHPVLSGRTARVVGMSVLVLAVGYSVYGQVSTQVQANEASDAATTAQQEAKSVADPLDEVCRSDLEVRRRLGDLCDKAAEVKDQPAPPQAARDGADGRGITATTIADGRLLITYTDGVVEDKGSVTGNDGAAGRGIASSTITAAGRLVLTYSDGGTEDVGVVVGPEGKAGTDGVKGRGVASVTVSPDSRLIVAYDDGTTADAGQLPAGPKGDTGEPGRGIESVAFDFDTCTATVTYTDGTSEPAPMTGCDDGPDSSDPADPPGGLLPGG